VQPFLGLGKSKQANAWASVLSDHMPFYFYRGGRGWGGMEGVFKGWRLSLRNKEQQKREMYWKIISLDGQVERRAVINKWSGQKPLLDLTLCCSRKYSYPSRGRFFSLNPTPPSGNSILVPYFP